MTTHFQNPASGPVPCPSNSYCPAGTTSPLYCDGPLYKLNDEEGCSASAELIGIIVGCSVGTTNIYLSGVAT